MSQSILDCSNKKKLYKTGNFNPLYTNSFEKDALLPSQIDILKGMSILEAENKKVSIPATYLFILADLLKFGEM